MDPISFIHSSIDGHLVGFHILETVSKAAMNVDVQISIQDPAFNSLGYIPSCGVAGLCVNSN